jgi:hypothetical protein
MDSIVTKKLWELKPHPQNNRIFGDPRDVPEFEEIKSSIRATGLQEPIVVKADGTILSGHLRVCALKDIAAERNQFAHEVDVQVRVHSDFDTTERELEYLFEANTHRRQLSPRQIAFAYKALLGNIEEVKPKARTRKGNGQGDQKRRPEIRERVARLFNVSVRNAENMAIIFQTAGVPVEVLDLVDKRTLPVKVASDAVKYAIEEVKRRDPNGPVVVAPNDVLAYLAYPKPKKGTRIKDLIRGITPDVEPILVDGEKIQEFYGRVPLSHIPPPFMPKQKVKDMLLNGVEYSAQEYSDPGLPLYEAVNRLRARLVEAFASAHDINEVKVAEALEPMLERVAHFLRSMGKEVTVSVGEKETKKGSLPDSLYEKLVIFRAILEEDDPSCDPNVLRTILMDVARAAQEKASAIRKAQLTIPVKATTPSNVPRKESPVFDSDIAYITHALGQNVIDILGANI